MVQAKHYWIVGGLAGLAVGSLVIGVGVTQVFEGGRAEELFHYFGAIPLYAIPGFVDLPEPVIVQAFLIWWPALGALVGGLFAKGKGWRVAALGLLPIVAILHVQTKILVDEELEEAAERFNYLLETLID